MRRMSYELDELVEMSEHEVAMSAAEFQHEWRPFNIVRHAMRPFRHCYWCMRIQIPSASRRRPQCCRADRIDHRRIHAYFPHLLRRLYMDDLHGRK